MNPVCLWGFILQSLCECNSGAFKPTFYTDVTLTIQQNGQMLAVCDCSVVCHHFKLCAKQLCPSCESFFFSFNQEQQALRQSM